MMPDTAKKEAMLYLYNQIRKKRIAVFKAKGKPNSAAEIANLEKKIRVLEWLVDVVTKEES